jgi:hypothetical protein
MMLSMVLFVAAVVVPACTFYAYAISQFLREALRMRSERLASAQMAAPFPGAAKAAVQTRSSAVVPFLPNPSRSGQRGAA